MAITFNSIPEAYALSRNPLIFDIDTDNYVTTAGVKAKQKFDFTTNPSDGDYLRIGASVIMGVSHVQFDCDDTPDTPIEFASIGSETQEEYLDDTVIPAIKSSWYINQHFDVYREQLAIVIEAKEYGPDYDIDTLTANGFTINVIDDVSGVLMVTEDDFKIRYRVNLESSFGGTEFDQSPWFYLIPGEDGNVDIDISKVTDEMFDRLNLLVNSLSTQTQEKLSIRRLYLEVAEHFGSDPFDSYSHLSDHISVMKGGFASRDLDQSFKTLFVDAKKFITNLPDLTRCMASTKLFLHFIFNHTRFGGEDVLFKAKVYWKDNTTDETTLITDSAMEIGELWAIPAGFDQNNLQALDPTKEAYKWEIWAEGATLPVEAVKKFSFALVDDNQLEHSLQYYNGYGLLETLHCQAESRRSIEAQREHLQIEMPSSPDSEDSRMAPYALEVGEEISFATGSIPQKHAEALTDVLLSQELYWMPPSWAGSVRFAVTLVPDSYQLGYRNHLGQHVAGIRFTVRLNQEVSSSNINKLWSWI